MITNLDKFFTKMGARVKIRNGSPNVNIRKDKDGEFFDVTTDCDTLVLDVQPKQRHLLLMTKDDENEKRKFLCGHDERAWFVAAVPNEQVSNVKTAMEALKPREVRESQNKKKVKSKNLNRRHNKGFLRQGEWFFIPAPDTQVDETLILKREPLQRGRNKPHFAEFLYRQGGQRVYVSPQYPNGISVPAYERIIKDNPTSKASFRMMVRNPVVYVRGRITHPDHATLSLAGWHRVVPNQENRARWAGQLAFLD